MSVRVLFATAELAPLARVGGLAEAASGLVKELRRRDDVSVDVVLPDYGGVELDDVSIEEIGAPDWAGGTAWLRHGTHPEIGPITLVATAGTARPHPYVDEWGNGWPDNDTRFFGFSAAVAAIAERSRPDVIHLNDWHTAATIGFAPPEIPTVLTIHTLGHQGHAGSEWLTRIPHYREAFAWFGGVNPLAAGIRRVDRVIAVSPHYATEILTDEMGAGLNGELAARGDALVGIRNGIDVEQWDPAIDAYIPVNYGTGAAASERDNQRALLERVGLPVPHDLADVDEPVVGVVSRLVEQKGIDLLVETLPFFEHMGAKLVALGAGDVANTTALEAAAERWPKRVAFVDGYDLALAHLIFAGADLFAMPSRFEPCGLAQMQAMAYGTLPVVTAVGGLVDTVTDLNDDPVGGTGFVAQRVDAAYLTDALHRSVQWWHRKSARAQARRNGMTTDWSWSRPAAEHVEIYRALAP